MLSRRVSMLDIEYKIKQSLLLQGRYYCACYCLVVAAAADVAAAVEELAAAAEAVGYAAGLEAVSQALTALPQG